MGICCCLLDLQAKTGKLTATKQKCADRAGDTVAADYVPVPLTEMVCGLPPPLSVTLRDAERAPVAAGSKITLMVQLAFAARLLPQLLVCEKSPGLVPVKLMRAIEAAVVPVLVRVTGAGALVVPTFWSPKFTPMGERVITVPTPPSDTVCGLVLALSVTVSVPVAFPFAAGLKVTLIWQVPAIPSVEGQLLVSVNAPEMAMFETATS